jgi:hypothetical protein
MIPCQRHLFDIPDDVAYLNCAYMSPLMKPALEAGTQALPAKRIPGKSRPTNFLPARTSFALPPRSSIDCSPDDIAIVPSASYGIATAARNLPLKKARAFSCSPSSSPPTTILAAASREAGAR